MIVWAQVPSLSMKLILETLSSSVLSVWRTFNFCTFFPFFYCQSLSKDAIVNNKLVSCELHATFQL